MQQNWLTLINYLKPMKKRNKLLVISLIGVLLISCTPTDPSPTIDTFYYKYQNKTDKVITLKIYNNNEWIPKTTVDFDTIILSPNQCSDQFTLHKTKEGVEMAPIDSIDIISYKENVLLKRYRRYHALSKPSLTKTPFDINYYVSGSSIVGCSTDGSQVYLVLTEDLP